MSESTPPRFVEKSPAVFAGDAQPVTVGASDIEMLKKSAAASQKKRARICAHASSTHALHEMLIVLHRDTYVRPHRHHGKCESMHAIEGRAALVYYTEAGEPCAIRILGLSRDADCFFCRTNDAVFHTVVVLDENFVFHETVQGPFQAKDTEYASWAPAEEDTEAVAAFRKELAHLLEENSQPDSRLRAVSL
jgi:cupin fold WbuC family metalloprotein